MHAQCFDLCPKLRDGSCLRYEGALLSQRDFLLFHDGEFKSCHGLTQDLHLILGTGELVSHCKRLNNGSPELRIGEEALVLERLGCLWWQFFHVSRMRFLCEWVPGGAIPVRTVSPARPTTDRAGAFPAGLAHFAVGDAGVS